MATIPGYIPPRPDAGSDDASALRQHTREIASSAAQMLQGKLNVTATLTLTANAASTILTDPRLRAAGNVVLLPMTAHAATALATTYVLAADMNNEAWTITHANNAQVDRTFRVTIIG